MSIASDHSRVGSIMMQMSHLSGIREQQEGGKNEREDSGGRDLNAVASVLIMGR